MTIQLSTCPLCQQDNHCSRAANSESSSCWCQTATISTTLIRQAREKNDVGRCICRRCADLAATLTRSPE